MATNSYVNSLLSPPPITSKKQIDQIGTYPGNTSSNFNSSTFPGQPVSPYTGNQYWEQQNNQNNNWSQPSANNGVTMYAGPGSNRQPSVFFRDANGANLTNISLGPDPSDLLRNMYKFGLPLSSLTDLQSQITSDKAIGPSYDLNALSKGGLGTDFDWTYNPDWQKPPNDWGGIQDNSQNIINQKLADFYGLSGGSVQQNLRDLKLSDIDLDKNEVLAYDFLNSSFGGANNVYTDQTGNKHKGISPTLIASLEKQRADMLANPDLKGLVYFNADGSEVYPGAAKDAEMYINSNGAERNGYTGYGGGVTRQVDWSQNAPSNPSAYMANGMANGNNGVPYSDTPGQVTFPSMANNNAPGWIQQLSNSIPQWFNSMNNLNQLPNNIDSWLTEAMKNQRGTGDQVLNLLGNISEQQAGSGIMGGTEDTALKSRVLSDFMRQINDNKLNLTNTANTMKAQAISAMPGAAMSGVSALSNLYGQNASDQYNWANLAAQMLMSNY